MNIMGSSYRLQAIVGIALFTMYALRKMRSRRPKLPPGPKPNFLIGNLLHIPKVKPWLTYNKWQEEYGDIIYMKALGMDIVVLSSLQMCTDLLDKRSARYSDRPPLVMLTELMGWGYFLPFMRYSSRWRSHRRLLHNSFNEHKVADYQPIQIRSTHALMRRLLNDPERFLQHLRFSFADSIMEVVYGIKVEDHDTYVRQAEEAVGLICSLANVGLFMVDLFPPLKYIPSWLPGAGFKRKAAQWRPMSVQFKALPFEHVRKNMEMGIAGPSVLSTMLETSAQEKVAELDEHPMESPEEVAKNTAAVVYAAGADTTVSSTQALFLALVEYPEVLKAAQVELDAVIGNNRLPTFEDAPKLPYISALIKELLRWHNVTPLSFTHVCAEDDEYNGYFIPKGTLILPNIWSILHDPVVFPEPFRFDPLRWLIDTPTGRVINKDLPDPHQVAFGFGRRVCPGKFFAANSLFIIVSTVLACFDVTPPKDSSGNPLPVKGEFTDGLISYPVPYKVSLVPRSERVTALIRETEL